jgi:hypothetical protein
MQHFVQTYWGRAFSDAVIAQCVPVLIADGVVLPFDNLIDW